MENNYYENQSTQNLIVTDVVKDYLLETAKWAKFIAIIGFVMVGLMLVMALFMGSIMASLAAFSPEAGMMPAIGGGFFTVIYILIAAVYFIPIKYLFDFSRKVKSAIEIKNQNLFTEAMMKLKSHYKFIGVLMLIIVSLYVIMFVMILVGGLAAAAL